MLSVEGLRIYSDHFMGVWAARDSANTVEESGSDFQTFCLWVLLAVLGAFLRGWLVVYVALTSSENIHRRLLARLMSAPIGLFDTTPRGRILGHFSKDLDAVDALLPQYLLDFLQAGSGVLLSSPKHLKLPSLKGSSPSPGHNDAPWHCGRVRLVHAPRRSCCRPGPAPGFLLETKGEPGLAWCVKSWSLVSSSCKALRSCSVFTRSGISSAAGCSDWKFGSRGAGDSAHAATL